MLRKMQHLIANKRDQVSIKSVKANNNYSRFNEDHQSKGCVICQTQCNRDCSIYSTSVQISNIPKVCVQNVLCVRGWKLEDVDATNFVTKIVAPYHFPRKHQCANYCFRWFCWFRQHNVTCRACL